jgi:hypothetical protein
MATLVALSHDQSQPASGHEATSDERVSRTKVLESETRIGRGADCQLRLDESHVSTQHASIRWMGQGWQIRDLGSRNGTTLDGAVLSPRVAYALREGSVIGFGSPRQSWRLVDSSGPLPMVIAEPGENERAIVSDDGLIAIPEPDNPLLTIYRSHGGQWLGERGNEVEPFENGRLFLLDGVSYRFANPEEVTGTVGLDPAMPLPVSPHSSAHVIRQTPLEFLVSHDEEHVDLVIGAGERARQVRARAHFYLLLILARCRIEDTRNGLPDSACGWRYGDELCTRLRIPSEQLNVQIFRIRREFSSIGYVDAAEIIERRPSTRQLRIGIDGNFLTVTPT